MNQERDELIKTMVRTFLEKSERQAYSDRRIDLDAMAAVLDLCVKEFYLVKPPKPKTAQEKIEAILDANFLGPGTNSKVAAEIIAELKQKEQR